MKRFKESVIRRIVKIGKKDSRLIMPAIVLAAVFLVCYHAVRDFCLQFRYHPVRQRLLVGILIVSLLVGRIGLINLFAATDSTQDAENMVISGFEKLPEEVREQTVFVGTGLDGLTLPDTLEASVILSAGGNNTEDAGQEAEEAEGEEPETGETESEELETDDTQTEDAGTENAADDDVRQSGGTEEAFDEETETNDMQAEEASDEETNDVQTEESAQDEGAPDESTDVADTQTDESADAEEQEPQDTEEITTAEDTGNTENNGESLYLETYTVTMEEYYEENVITVETLTADNAQTKNVTITGVTWLSVPEYDGSAEGTYLFTAVLPEGYALMDGVSLPEITVTVQENEEDAAVQALFERIAALPDLEEYLAAEPDMDNWEKADNTYEEVYTEWLERLYQYAEEVFAIWEEYEVLTEEQKAQIPETEMAKLTAWAEFAETLADSMAVMTVADEEATRISSDLEWEAQTLAAGTYIINEGVTVTVSGRLTVDGEVTITGGGTLVRSGSYAGVSSSGSGSALLYVAGGSLTLENITVDGNFVNAYGPAVYVVSGSMVTMNDGAVIQNNYNMNSGPTGTYAAGGIYCAGTLNINGGTIWNCKTSGTVGSDVYAHAGGGVYLKGTCNMTSGSITGNYASNGGGIYLASGATLDLIGGTISGNTVSGSGSGIYYSTVNNSNGILKIGGDANISDTIYLDITTGTLYPLITSELHYRLTLGCSTSEDGKILAAGSGYTLTGVDVSKISMENSGLYSILDTENNQIILSTSEEAEAIWQEMPQGEWKTGRFTTALEEVYSGGTIKLLKDIIFTETVEITKTVTITSNDSSDPCTITRMPSGTYGNITLTESGHLTLVDIIYDGNRDYVSGGGENQSLIKVGSADDREAALTLGGGCIIRNGYKSDGSGVIAVYGTMTMESGAVIENCEVTGTGGAVWVSSSGIFNMNGGTIRGCTAGQGGAAVSLDGSCVLSGGSITGNTDSSGKSCDIYLRSSGSGSLTLNGVSISGNTYSVYNDGKSVTVAGDSTLSGRIYTTKAIEASKNGVNSLIESYTIEMSSVTNGMTVICGSTDNSRFLLANEGYTLAADGSDLVAATAYTVTYDYAENGGASATKTTAAVAVGDAIDLTPIATKEDWTFVGWNTDKNAVQGLTSLNMGEKDITLYAIFIPNTYAVTLNGNGGDSGTTLTSYNYGTGAVLPTDWTKTGYTFAGWYDNADCTGIEVTGISTTAMGNKEYWAKWVDDIAPVIGALSYSYQPKNLWHWLIGKDDLIITVSVTEEGSGADEITYTVTPEGSAAEQKTAVIKNGTATITLSADFQGTIVISSTDKDGNTSAGVTVGGDLDSDGKGFLIEDNAPEITFAANNGENISGEYYDAAPDITVTVTDDADNAISAGIASITYQIGTGEEITVNKDFATQMVTESEFDIAAGDIPTGETIITVTATDNAGNETSETITVKVKSPESKPAAAINYQTEMLTGLEPNAEYTINGMACRTDADGCIAIDDNWIGTTMELVRKGNGTETIDSEAQSISIPARTAQAPSPGAEDERSPGAGDGKLTGLEAGTAYQISTDNGATWTNVTSDENGEIINLAPGSYIVRIGSTDTDFASKPSAPITIAAGPVTYTVTLHGNGGSGTALTSYTCGEGTALPTDWAKMGYTFGGWYDNEDCTGTAVTAISSTDTGDQEYWAKWNKKSSDSSDNGSDDSTDHFDNDTGNSDNTTDNADNDTDHSDNASDSDDKEQTQTPTVPDNQPDDKKESTDERRDDTDSTRQEDEETPKQTEPSGETDTINRIPEGETDTTNRIPEGETVQTVPVEVDGGKLVLTGKPVETGNLTDTSKTTTVLMLGDGAVIVTVVCEDDHYTAGVKDTVAVANIVLTPERLQLVYDGEIIEIRIDATDISQTIGEQDKEVIEQGLEAWSQEIPELTLGMYVDISMFIRIGASDWDTITFTDEPIDIVIGIPEELKEDGRKFYIIRSHEGAYALLNDKDSDADTITISTDSFSAYAIAYQTTEETSPETGEATETAKCSLCHICPTFLGICCFIWLAVVIVLLAILAWAIFHKRKESNGIKE